MPGSPALKIVRHQKSLGDVKTVPQVVPQVTHSNLAKAKPIVAADGPLPATMTDVEIAHELQFSVKTIRRMHKDGKLPTPVVVGARSLRWLRKTIDEWLIAACPDRATFEADQKGGF